MQIGLIGTGLMGLPMAQRLLGAGFSLTAYNRTAAKLEPLQTAGAAIAPDPLTVLQNSDCTILMLTNAAAIHETVLPDGTRSVLPGKTLIQMGTIAPQESREIHAMVTASGGSYLEAPVLGSIPEARDGKLLVMVGGTPDQYTQWLPVLQCFGESPRLIGGVGQAAAVKLALNQLIGSLTAAFSTSLGFLLKENVAIEPFMEILRQSALYAPTFDKKLQKMLDQNFENPNFPTKHLYKDIHLFNQAAQLLNLDVEVVQAVEAILERSLAQGLADKDYSSLFATILNQGAADQ
ncbi:MAG TPA: NAD(P)-dependent oxidoreductase [Leptolyngbyaceae cyanobacterium M33_DOE_097]|uniref:NAD(P)-dependent oxidoreductase n=1 Tax=Oscillatoriales cyanobacterium SpSt-418 TaxID=2282169 RepID=A0A7C3PIU7_9CYAN|nr:NAD(P)-dependent oxidoreductase [Leptolyngbyaceae cyanobacterium M33_DOE_097]